MPRRLTTVVILLVVAGTAIVISVTSLRNATRGSPAGIEPALASSPEGKLVYPGARNVTRSGQLAECSDGVWQPAGIEMTFTTPDPIEAVDRWYTDRLSPLGWTPSGPPGPSYVLIRGINEHFAIYANNSEVATDFQQPVKVGAC